MSLEILICLGTALFTHEALASGCTEDCTATVDRATDTLRCKILDFIVDKAFPATVYSFDVPSVIDGSTRHGSDSRIHSRRITS